MADVPTGSIDPTNTAQAQAWDGDEGRYWAAHANHFDRAVAAYHSRLLDAANVAVGSRVLDIGCGCGQATLDAARRASSGSALGLDLSSHMLVVARDRARSAGLANASFVQADAQSYPFTPSSFDIAISRSGAMFFGDPAAAWVNISQALDHAGRLVLLAWQGLSENEWMRSITSALAAGRDLPGPPPNAPGPFGLSDPDRVTQLLVGAGFKQPEFESLSELMWFGDSAEDAFEFIIGAQGWMVRDLDDDARLAALEALRQTIVEHQTPDGVRFGSSAWLITTATL